MNCSSTHESAETVRVSAVTGPGSAGVRTVGRLHPERLQGATPMARIGTTCGVLSRS